MTAISGTARLDAESAPFYSSAFDAHEYVKQFLGPALMGLGGDQQEGSNRASAIDSDMRVALSRLNMCITEVDQHIHALVSNYSEDFLTRLSRVTQVRNDLATVVTQATTLQARSSSYVLFFIS